MDNVHAPYHYCHDGIECKDAMRAMMGEQVGYSSMLYVWWGMAFKYIWRWSRKNGVEDLHKAKQCIDFMIGEIGDE